MARSEELYLADIVEAADAIGRYVAGRSLDDFLKDEVLRSAVLFQLVIIGEAAAHIRSPMRQRYSAIEWADVVAFRNFAVHAYFAVNWTIVWSTATKNAPKLASDVEAILRENAASPPAAQHRPTPATSAPSMVPTLIVHADWGTNAHKRWLATAALGEDGGYIAHAPEPIGDANTLLRRLADMAGPWGSVLVGFDFPIGLPAAYAVQAEIDNFLLLLPRLGEGLWSDFYKVAARPDEISLRRPFYPDLPGGTSHQHLLEAHRVATIDDLRRRCDLAHQGRRAASPIFWTLGAQQVGKAAISGWRDVLTPGMRDANLDLTIWPFAGPLNDLIRPGRIVVVETYPAEFYGHLGVVFPQTTSGERSGKTSQSSRAGAAPVLIQWAGAVDVILAPPLLAQLEDGFGPTRDGEDPFDATIGLLGMINVVLGHRSSGEPDDPRIQTIEGWMFGQERS